ncbi:hypothetical protein GCM10027053_52040 [Intrasporangium mesophilum]
MTTAIDLGGQSFGTGVRDANGALWKMALPRGWDAPIFRNEDGAPTFRDGAYEAEALHGARALVCSGLVRCATDALAWQVYYLLPTLSPVGRDIDLVVHEPGGDKFLKVRQGAKPDIRTPQAGVVFFELNLKALYPFKRSTTPMVRTINAGATDGFACQGTVAAEMEVRTLSSGTVTLKSYGAVQGTGATSVPSGTVFTSGFGFSNPERTVIGPAGENLYNSLIPANHWLAAQPGTNTVQNSGTANVRLTYYPTWE